MIQLTGLDGERLEVDAHALEALSERIDGSVLRAGGAPFEEAVQIWNGMISSRPAVVVQPASANDVREAIGFARANGILLSIKGGGHNIAGTSLADGGLTLDMSRLRTVEVDAERRVARVAPGAFSATWIALPRSMDSRRCSAPTLRRGLRG